MRILKTRDVRDLPTDTQYGRRLGILTQVLVNLSLTLNWYQEYKTPSTKTIYNLILKTST
jgi:hypothetical protein